MALRTFLGRDRCSVGHRGPAAGWYIRLRGWGCRQGGRGSRGRRSGGSSGSSTLRTLLRSRCRCIGNRHAASSGHRWPRGGRLQSGAGGRNNSLSLRTPVCCRSGCLCNRQSAARCHRGLRKSRPLHKISSGRGAASNLTLRPLLSCDHGGLRNRQPATCRTGFLRCWLQNNIKDNSRGSDTTGNSRHRHSARGSLAFSTPLSRSRHFRRNRHPNA